MQTLVLLHSVEANHFIKKNFDRENRNMCLPKTDISSISDLCIFMTQHRLIQSWVKTFSSIVLSTNETSVTQLCKQSMYSSSRYCETSALPTWECQGEGGLNSVERRMVKRQSLNRLSYILQCDHLDIYCTVILYLDTYSIGCSTDWLWTWADT